MTMDYEQLKDMAREKQCRITDLIALAPQNDPFYVGTSGDWEKGRWFADLWERFPDPAAIIALAVPVMTLLSMLTRALEFRGNRRRHRK